MNMNNIKNALLNDSLRKVFEKEILDKLDSKPSNKRSYKLKIKINEKNFPFLYQDGDEYEHDFLKDDINTLLGNIFAISCIEKNKILPLPDKNASLVFNYEYEELLREVYKRELKKEESYEELLKKYCNENSELFNILKKNKFEIPTKSKEEILKKLFFWINSDKKSSSQKQESARCFYGMSKMFDKKEEFNKYFNLLPLSISLQVCSKSTSFKNVLFIENLDTFYSCLESDNTIFDNTVLIYSSGYKLSSKRIRQKAASKIFFESSCLFKIKEKKEFLSWFYKELDLKINVYAWCDLDYSGIDILNKLKNNFEELKEFLPAYKQMLGYLNEEMSHTPIMANKDQKEPNSNEFESFSKTLIKQIKEKNLFLDQETIDINSLKK